MSIFEYDEELHKKTLLEEGYEKGLERGRSEGLERGRSEGLERGRSEGRAEAILCLLQGLGTTPDDVRNTILSATDTKLLEKWLRLAAKVDSVEAFIQAMTKE